MERIHIRAVVMLVGVVVAMVVLLAGIWLGGHPGDLPSPLRGRLFESRRSETVTEQALNILTTRYYRPVNRSALVDVGLSGMVASLEDPYSDYLDPRSYRERREQSTQELVGIGVSVVAEPSGLLVVNVFEHSLAAGAGLAPGDLIIKVGSSSLADQSGDHGSELIRGPAGTPVKLTFMRGDTQHVISVERAKVVVPVATRQMLVYHHVRIGHLTLTGFTDGSGDELRAEVRAALDAHSQALILDLRGNGGGLINEAINVASAFITRGEIMSPGNAARGALDITLGEFFTPDGRHLGGGGARQGAGITPNV
jgi:carboxyl-terminal processing protease